MILARDPVSYTLAGMGIISVGFRFRTTRSLPKESVVEDIRAYANRSEIQCQSGREHEDLCAQLCVATPKDPRQIYKNGPKFIKTGQIYKNGPKFIKTGPNL